MLERLAELIEIFLDWCGTRKHSMGSVGTWSRADILSQVGAITSVLAIGFVRAFGPLRWGLLGWAFATPRCPPPVSFATVWKLTDY